jgi:hypothetical protein
MTLLDRMPAAARGQLVAVMARHAKRYSSKADVSVRNGVAMHDEQHLRIVDAICACSPGSALDQFLNNEGGPQAHQRAATASSLLLAMYENQL